MLISMIINELENENIEVEKILIGNDRGIDKKREITKENAENLAKKYKMKYFEIFTGKSKLFTELFNNNFINVILKDSFDIITSLEENKNNLNDVSRKEPIEDKYYKEYRNIIEYMVRSSDEELYMSIKDKQEKMNNQLPFFFLNDFAQKIFDLFDKLLKYSPKNLESIYDFMEFLKSENEKLKDIISEFPLLNYKNKNAYFASYYFYALNKLLNYFNYYKNKNNNDNDEYKSIEYFEEEKKEEKAGKNEENEYEEEKNQKIEIKIKLEEKKKNLEIEFEKIIDNYNNILLKKTKNQNDEQILSNFSLKIGTFQTAAFQLKNVQENYIKLKNILDNFDNYYSEFFQEYLKIFSLFLNSIPLTLQHFKEKKNFHEKLSYENLKLDIEEFDYFIFYIFNYDYVINIDKLSQIVNLFEGIFQNKKNNFSSNADGYNFVKKDNILIQSNPIGKKIILENCDNYCIDLIKKEKLKKSRYLNEKFLYTLNFPKFNAFEKYKKVYKDFFIKIFNSKCVKELFISIFPYLDAHYSIINDLLNEAFNKMRAFNFKPFDFLAETISPILNIYIKNYFEANDDIESEICVSAAFIILIFHELAHYIRIYIYKITGDKEYRKSIDICGENEMGVFLEKKLFGEEIHSINFYQAIFLLNEVNYNLSYVEFSQNFQNLKNNHKKEDYSKDLMACKEFLNSIGLNVKNLDISNSSNTFNIKSSKNILFLGANNDKKGREVNLEEIFNGTGFEYLLKRNQNTFNNK